MHVLFVQFILKSFTYQLHDLGQVTSLGPFQLSDPISMQLAHLYNALNTSPTVLQDKAGDIKNMGSDCMASLFIISTTLSELLIYPVSQFLHI